MDSAHLALLQRPELGVTFTKLHCWTLTQYSKCVFLDADMLAVQNSDDLFQFEEMSASCDVGWPDCFNSGMFVFSPSMDTYGRLVEHAKHEGSFDGGDQGLLNTFFKNWHRVSFIYNMIASAAYTYLPAYKKYGNGVRLVHFLGSLKPWHYQYDSQSGAVSVPKGHYHVEGYLNHWWALYANLILPGLPKSGPPPKWDDHSSYHMTQLREENLGCKDSYHSHVPSKVAYCGEAVSSLADSTVRNESLEKIDVNMVSVPIVYTEIHEAPEIENTFFEPHERSAPYAQSDIHSESTVHAKVLEDILPAMTLSTVETNPHFDTSCSEHASTPFSTPPHSVTSDDREKDDHSPVCCPCSIAFSTHTMTEGAEPDSESLGEVIVPEWTDDIVEVEAGELTEELEEIPETLEEARERWEGGQPDYLGRDSFENIMIYIQGKLKEVQTDE